MSATLAGLLFVAACGSVPLPSLPHVPLPSLPQAQQPLRPRATFDRIGAAQRGDGQTAEAAPLPAGGPASTEPVLWTDAAGHPKGYLAKAGGMDAAALLPPPPEDADPRGVADRIAFKETRKLKDSPRWVMAIRDADVETPVALRAFDCAVGHVFDPEKEPALGRILAKTAADIDAANKAPKADFARKRPFLSDDKAPVCVAKDDWLVHQGSYPSGHAAIGWAWALILSELAPDRAAEITRRGLQFGESRVVCGVHYPSDVEAGRTVGAALVARLHGDPAFMADLRRARADLAAGRLAAPPMTSTCTIEAAALKDLAY